jgi:hypothetical protein
MRPNFRTRSIAGSIARTIAKTWMIFLFVAACLTRAASAQDAPLDRTVLPIPHTQYKYPGKVPIDARDAKFPRIKELRPPEGAPNIVVVLLDDIGFGAPSTFGGGVSMPTMDHSRSRVFAIRSFTRRRSARRPARRS